MLSLEEVKKEGEDEGSEGNVEDTTGTVPHGTDPRTPRAVIPTCVGPRGVKEDEDKVQEEGGLGNIGRLSGLLKDFQIMMKRPGSATPRPIFSSGPGVAPVDPWPFCSNCSDFRDWCSWLRVEPALTVVDGKVKYRITTIAGRYQCRVTGLRWESSCKAELEYCLDNWDRFREFLEKERFIPCGPLMDLRVISGEITATHLPHFLCTGFHEENDVRVLGEKTAGVSLEKCRLLLLHAVLTHNPFLLQGVVISSQHPVKVHCDLLIYCTEGETSHLTLHVYVFPWDLNVRESVEKREKDSLKVVRSGLDIPLQLEEVYSLSTSCPSHITPQKLKLTFPSTTLNCFEVFVQDAKKPFNMGISPKGPLVWVARIQPDEIIWNLGDEFADKGKVKPRLPLRLPIRPTQRRKAKLQTTEKHVAKLSASAGASSVHSSQRGSGSFCKLCSSLQDTTEWKIIEAEAEEHQHYRLSSAAGSYECSVSGLRWVCDGDVSLKYHFSDWELYRGELRRMQFEPCGPLMDITVVSGVLTEVHLPHVACLGWSPDSLKDEVRVLDVQDGGMFLEKCELTRFHAKLLHPTFSPKGLLIRSGFPVKVHCEVLIYQILTAHLTLHVYLVTSDENIIQKVENKENKSVKIDKPGPERSLTMRSRFKIQTKKEDAHFSSKIKPERLKLRYSPIKYCEVYIRNADEDFELHLINERGESVWDVEIRAEEYRRSPSITSGDRQKRPTIDYAVWFVNEHRSAIIQRVSLVSPIADDLKPFIGDEKYSVVTACRTSQEQMRKLYDFLSEVGRLEKMFYQSLLKNEPLLVAELAGADLELDSSLHT